MHTAMGPLPLVQEPVALLPAPPRLLGLRRQPRIDTPVDEEEPEIIRLLAAHYRTLLTLRQLTTSQRDRLSGMAAACEFRLSGPGNGVRQRLSPALNASPVAAGHQQIECLTAIRLYAAGAQRALAAGRPDAAAQGVARIGEQVARFQALLAAPCLSGRSTKREPPPATAPSIATRADQAS